jgi:hypothetical protein
MTYPEQKRFCKGLALPTPYEAGHYFQATTLSSIGQFQMDLDPLKHIESCDSLTGVYP